MKVAYLSGRTGPERLVEALGADFVFAHPRATIVLREGERSVPAALLAGRGARRVLYRLALSPEVSAPEAVVEGWVDALAESEAEATALAADATVSPSARSAVRRLLAAPSRRALAALERAEFALIQASADKPEGIAAFFERREPRFSVR